MVSRAAQRPAASELMLNRSGLPVDDHAVSMPGF